MKKCLLLLLGSVFYANAQVPELLYYNFENVTGTSVPNLASSPPAGTSTATIMGGLTIGANGVCPGNSLIGSGGISSTNYLDTNWNFNLSGSWTIHLKLGNNSPGNPSDVLFYYLGDATTEFRLFTNGVAGANNLILRANLFNDIQINNVFDATNTGQKDVIITYDSVLGVSKAYVNGVLTTTKNQNTGKTFNGSSFKVGAYNSNTGLKSGQTLDEFGLYNRALSDAEALAVSGACNLLATDEVVYSKAKPKFVVHNDTLLLNDGKIGEYKVYDMSGKLVLSNMSKSNTIDISTLTKGVYTIKTADVTQRFIK